MSDTPPLLSEDADGILIVTLNRPEKLNSLTNETMKMFEEALLRFRDSAELHVMLIRATGRYFCAGADITEPSFPPGMQRTASGLREAHRIHNRGMHRIYDEMEHIEKPIVAAHQAVCVGGGLEISLACDFRLAAKSASYRFPEGMFGLLPASNGVSRLTRLCGPHWTRWLIMANKPADADMAFTMGLVHQVFPDDIFEREVMDFCRHLAKQNPEQMGAAKIAIEMAYEVGRDMGRHVERMTNTALMLNPDYLDAAQNYVQGVGRKNAD